ncbi:MAG: NAD-dependent dehydratase, partial [Kocuria sp.]|nr:NAD-dependent dehydratase [Kocuria sp.]
MTHHVLLAGCGDVGTALGQRLVERGWHATGVRRRPGQLPAEISPFALDLTNPGAAALPPADAVVITLTADGRDVHAYQRTYLGALRGLHRALSSGGSAPKRVVLVSS